MKTIVEIKILGLALCYRRTGGNWKVLLPWDARHQILFSHEYDGATPPNPPPPIPPMPLAVANGVIKISATNAITTSGQTSGFAREVFNFTTDQATSGYHTHNSVSLRPDWQNGTVLLEIENASFAPDTYLSDLTKELVYLNGQDANGNSISTQLIGFSMAHSLKALITLDDGGVLSVKRGVSPAEPTTEIASISGGGRYTIIFNNDCDDMTPGPNDMFLYYDKTIMAAPPPPNSQEKYWIGSVGHLGEGLPMSVETPDRVAQIPPIQFFPFTGVFLSLGKPCMGGQINPPPPDFP